MVTGAQRLLLMLSKTYEALRAAGAEDKALAADELASGEARLAGIDWKLAASEARLASLDRLIWAVVINATATMTMLVKHW
jgi:hypothetical protein